MAYHDARREKEVIEAAEREAAKILANPFEDSPVTVDEADTISDDGVSIDDAPTS
jgi:DNA-directed RNA polymerase subunit beta'